MKKVISFLVLAVIAGLVVVYFVSGPSFLMGGPNKTAIVDVARSAMAATAPTADEAERVKTAQITPQGICSHMSNDDYACIVNVALDAQTTRPFVAVLRRSPDGGWISGE